MDILQCISQLIYESTFSSLGYWTKELAEDAVQKSVKNTGDLTHLVNAHQLKMSRLKGMDISKLSKPISKPIPSNVTQVKVKTPMSTSKKLAYSSGAGALAATTGKVYSDVQNQIQKNQLSNATQSTTQPNNNSTQTNSIAAKQPSAAEINRYWKTDANGHVTGTNLTPGAYYNKMKLSHPGGTRMDAAILKN